MTTRPPLALRHDVAGAVELLESPLAAGDLGLTAELIARRKGWFTPEGPVDVERASRALEQAELDGIVERVPVQERAVARWRKSVDEHGQAKMMNVPLAALADHEPIEAAARRRVDAAVRRRYAVGIEDAHAEHERDELASKWTLVRRSDEARRGYVDGFAALAALAADWAGQGKTFDEFIAGAALTLPLIEEPERGLRFDLAHTRELAVGTTLSLVPSDDDPAKREETDVPPIALIVRSGSATVQDYLTPAAAQELGLSLMRMSRLQGELDAGAIKCPNCAAGDGEGECLCGELDAGGRR